MSKTKENSIDKSGWGDGPWQSEPDRLEWEHAGFPCLMVRQPRLGHWCGYVAVPEGHPCFEKSYSAPWNDTTNEREPWPTNSIEVHGGLTYADHCSGNICHVPKPGEADNVWWLGFDCAHSGDLSPGMKRYGFSFDEKYKNVSYVKAETNNLANQLKAMIRARSKQ